ncbi:hypothetical protein C1646_773860 [Rhizophagus diaphanus]|nr:hypothetical protein C1646_773860 [Rhizophagus diaphanus] [Rhizophagus sp. MUCL 43196]
MAGAKLRELIKSMNVKAVLEELASNYSNILSNEKIKPIIRSWNFFNDLKVLAFILKPLRDTVLLLERSSANLSDCTCLKYGVWQRIVIIAGKKESVKLSDSEINAIVNDSLAELEPEEEDDEEEIIKEIQMIII